MTYTFVIGQKNYASWSMRAWLLLKMLNVPFTEITVRLYEPNSRDSVRALGGWSGLVPLLIDGGTAVWDTLAIFEHFYESHPAVWPAARPDRDRARSVSGGVHSGFQALRSAMPCNTRARERRVHPSTDCRALSNLWRQSRWFGTSLHEALAGAYAGGRMAPPRTGRNR